MGDGFVAFQNPSPRTESLNLVPLLPFWEKGVGDEGCNIEILSLNHHYGLYR